MSIHETEELVKTDRELIMHPASIMKMPSGWVVDKGKGLILMDTDGKEYMDFVAGLTCVNLGYGRKELAEAAMAEMGKLGYFPTFSGMSNRANIECAKKLKQLVPNGINHFFFASGGSDAVDSAFKFARLYWRRKGRGKYKILSLQNSYHGVSLGVVNATNLMSPSLVMGAEPLLPGFIHVPYYYCYRCPFGLEYPSCDTKCARFLETLIEIEGEETVAAFIGEPVQGSGGEIPPPPTYWPLVRRICTEHNVLLIDDEVMTGFGRTGKMFAMEHWDVKPDIMAMAKGITGAYFPFSVTGITDEIFETIAADPSAILPIAYTYSGHPVGSAVAIKAMEIYKKEKLVENSARVGKYLLDGMQQFMELPHVGHVHGLGLFCGIDLVTDKATKAKPKLEVIFEVGKRAMEKGLLVRAYREIVGLTPPLTCTTEEVDRALDILKPIIADIS